MEEVKTSVEMTAGVAKPADLVPTTTLAETKSALPAVQASIPRGLEAADDPDDIIIPRARLLQPGSPEVSATLPGQAPKNWAGQVIDSLTKEVLPMEFIPIIMKKEWIRFNPALKEDPTFNKDFEPGAIIWRSSDPDDPRVQKEGKFGPMGERPMATAFLNFLCLFPGHSTPAILGFKGSSYAAGKLLYNLILRSKKDAFSSKYRITLKQAQGPNSSTYYIMEVELVGPATPEEFKVCEELWQQFHAKQIRIDDEGLTETEHAAAPVQAPSAEPRPF